MQVSLVELMGGWLNTALPPNRQGSREVESIKGLMRPIECLSLVVWWSRDPVPALLGQKNVLPRKEPGGRLSCPRGLKVSY